MFDQLLDGKDADSLNKEFQKNLIDYYRKGSNPSDHGIRGNRHRKSSDQSGHNLKQLLNSNSNNSNSDEVTSSNEMDSKKNHTPTRAKNRFAKRMAKYMCNPASPNGCSLENGRSHGNLNQTCGSHKNSSGSESHGHDGKHHDESSSSRSSKLNSQRSNINESESLNEGLREFQFSQVPVNSFDGMNEGGYDDFARHSQTTETEEEDGVIDQGDGYKLSIMRKKRPLPAIIDDPSEEAP